MATYDDLFYDNFAMPAAADDLLGDWSFSAATAQYTLSTAKFDGRRSLRTAAGTVAVQARRAFDTAADYCVMGVRCFPDGVLNNATFLGFLGAAAANRVRLIAPTAGVGDVNVWLGATNTFSVADYILIGQSAYYEVEAYRHATNGFVGLYRDGDLKGSFSGDTTAIGGTMDRALIGAPGYFITTPNSYWTDFYCASVSDFGTEYGGHNLGPCYVHSGPVDSAVGTPDFAAAAGDNEDNLGVPHDGDTAYNESGTADHEDRFTADLSGKPAGSIFAAGIEIAAKQSELGTLEIRSTLSIGSARTTGTAYSPSAAYRVKLTGVVQGPGTLANLDYFGYQNQAGA